LNNTRENHFSFDFSILHAIGIIAQTRPDRWATRK
jgi:hypothetical protein